MHPSQVKSVSIAKGNDQPKLSKAQKTFNTLIKQIEQGRARLAAWEAIDTPYHQKCATELQPLITDADDLQVKLVHCLDRAHDQPALTKPERRKLASVITGMAEELLTSRDDDTLKAIFNKHSDIDYDTVEAAGQADLKAEIEDALGFELDDSLDLRSPEDLLAHAHAKIREQQAQEEADREAWQQRQSQRKKSPKQLAAEAKEQAEAQQLQQSVREIYRKLASALHPDREPDPKERERKTALMQRVNQAYAKNNLLQLLELQLELEHIDQAALNNVSEDRLKHYNKILREQLAELQHEILRVESGYMGQALLDPYAMLSPDSVMRNLAAEIASIKRAIRDVKRDLLAFADIQQVKAWLKTLRKSRRRDAFDDMLF